MCKLFGSKILSLDAYIQYARKQAGYIPRTEVLLSDVKAELEALGLKCMLTSDPDIRVFYTDEFTLTRIFPFLTFSAEYYVASLDVDCDDYSKWAAGFASLIFSVNGVFQVWGDSPGGPHAWSMAKVGISLYKHWEPNAGFKFAGELFNADEHMYIPKKWK